MVDPRREITNPGSRLSVGLIFAGLVFALTFIATASIPVSSDVIIWTVGPAFLFAAVSAALRWGIGKDRRRLFLLGRYPLVLGMLKLAGLVGVAALLLLCVAGLVIGGSFAQLALAAFVRGLVSAAVLNMIATGLLSLLVVARQLRGTLSDTSRQSQL